MQDQQKFVRFSYSHHSNKRNKKLMFEVFLMLQFSIMIDPEIEAMAKCHEQLNPLDDNTKVRVIQWLISKYELHSQTHLGNGGSTHGRPSGGEIQVLSKEISEPANTETLIAVPQKGNKITNFENVAELFAATNPKYDWEKVLVVATYFQLKNESSDFNSFTINKELKNLGHGVAKISRVIQTCIDKRPQLILQLRKEGKTPQAKKKYKVSGEGIKFVKNMLGV